MPFHSWIGLLPSPPGGNLADIVKRRGLVVGAFLLLVTFGTQISPGKVASTHGFGTGHARSDGRLALSAAGQAAGTASVLASVVPDTDLAQTAAPTVPATSPKAATPKVAPVSAGSFGGTPVHAQRGATITVYTDSHFASKASAMLDHLATLGVNSVSAVIVFTQSTYTSNDPHLAPYVASPQEMQTFITAAHQRGMSVMIRPLMNDGNLAPQWRGTVLPTDLPGWFSNYYNGVVRPYASLNGVDTIDIGSEMATLADRQPGWWLWLISGLRSSFPGVRLTYSSTDWIALPGQQQPYPTFAESLDLIGVDAFFPLKGVTNGYDINQLVSAWQGPLGEVNRLATYYHKPVLFTEIGLASECCTLSQPFVWNSQGAPNLQAQAVYYAAACRAIRPWRIGLYWWEYNGFDPLTSPAADNGFSPYGKPAEQEMARCYQSGY